MEKKLTTAQKWLVAIALGLMILVVVEIVEEQQRDEVRVAPKVDIYIGYTYTRVGDQNIALLGNYTPLHTFVLAQDRVTKRGFITRAGPESKCDDSRSRSRSLGSDSSNSSRSSKKGCPLFCKQAGDLSGENNLWAHSYWGKKECGPPLRKQHVGTINSYLHIVANRMKRLAKANNTCNSKEYSLGVAWDGSRALSQGFVWGVVGTTIGNLLGGPFWGLLGALVGLPAAAGGVVCTTPPYNSNSYAFSVVKELMGRRPDPDPPPPFDTDLIAVECTFHSVHGWDRDVSLSEC